MHAEGGHVPPDGGRHLLDQVRVEGGRPGDGCRVDRGPVGGEPGEALLVHDRRDAQPVAGHDDVLQAHHLGRALGDRHRATAVDPGQLAQAAGRGHLERHGAGRREDVLQRGDVERLLRCCGDVGVVDVGAVDRRVVDVHVVADPAAAELGDLLGQGQLGQQGRHPLVRRPSGITPHARGSGRSGAGFGGRHGRSPRATLAVPQRNFSTSGSENDCRGRPVPRSRLAANLLARCRSGCATRGRVLRFGHEDFKPIDSHNLEIYVGHREAFRNVSPMSSHRRRQCETCSTTARHPGTSRQPAAGPRLS